MNYTHYDYLELAPGATSKRIEAAYAALLERFQYGMTDAGQDLSAVTELGFQIVDVATREPDLEDVFLHLTTQTA